MSELDTSGLVAPFARYDPRWNAEPCGYRWQDLDAFTQGYVEALFEALGPYDWKDEHGGAHPSSFSDLAPETLAQIMADCARVQNLAGGKGKTAREGHHFWIGRQSGVAAGAVRAALPPLTVSLRDGKVYLSALIAGRAATEGGEG